MSELNELVFDVALALVESGLHLSQIDLGLNKSGKASYSLSHLITRRLLLHVSPESINVDRDFLDLSLRLLLALRDHLLDEVGRLIDISLALLLQLLEGVLHEVEVVLVPLRYSL